MKPGIMTNTSMNNKIHSTVGISAEIIKIAIFILKHCNIQININAFQIFMDVYSDNKTLDSNFTPDGTKGNKGETSPASNMSLYDQTKIDARVILEQVYRGAMMPSLDHRINGQKHTGIRPLCRI